MNVLRIFWFETRPLSCCPLPLKYTVLAAPAPCPMVPRNMKRRGGRPNPVVKRSFPRNSMKPTRVDAVCSRSLPPATCDILPRGKRDHEEEETKGQGASARQIARMRVRGHTLICRVQKRGFILGGALQHPLCNFHDTWLSFLAGCRTKLEA